MWQVRWKTLGHLSQQRSSPPFWQTAHQSSLGSSSGSAVFFVSGCPGNSDCCAFRALVLDRGGVASGGRDFAWAPVLLSGRLEPTVTFTSKRKINPLFYSCYTQSVSNIVLHMWQSPLRQKASSGFRNPLTKWTSSSSSSGSSLMTMTGPGEVFLRRLAAGADGVSKLGFQDVLLWNISRVRKLENFDHGIVLRRQSHPWFFFSVGPLDIRRIASLAWIINRIIRTQWPQREKAEA